MNITKIFNWKSENKKISKKKIINNQNFYDTNDDVSCDTVNDYSTDDISID